VAEAEIIHVHHETPRAVYNRYRREAMAFKRIFPESRFSLYDFFRLTVFNIISDLWHAFQQRVLLKNMRSIFWFRLMQFWGTYRGYRESGPLTEQLRQTFYYPRGFQVQGPGQTRGGADPLLEIATALSSLFSELRLRPRT
jgi:rhamnosyltransferase